MVSLLNRRCVPESRKQIQGLRQVGSRVTSTNSLLLADEDVDKQFLALRIIPSETRFTSKHVEWCENKQIAG